MDKQWYKDRIYGYECRAVGEISTALLNHEPKRRILKRCRLIFSELNRAVKLSDAEKHSLWVWTVNMYRKLVRQKDIPEAAARQFRAMEKEKNAIADSIEFREKHDWIMNMSDVFYRCSTHSNCAEGHKPYQGKIFINRELANEEELEFAEKNGIMDIREIMFAPVWLMTRKNCKHFFTPVASELVLNNTIPSEQVIVDTPLNIPYRAYYDRRKLLIAAGVSKKNDSYKRTVALIKKYR